MQDELAAAANLSARAFVEQVLTTAVNERADTSFPQKRSNALILRIRRRDFCLDG